MSAVECVIHGYDFLGNDRSVAQVVNDEVVGCSDDFDASLEGLSIGVGADERWQERMVDVHHALWKLADEPWT